MVGNKIGESSTGGHRCRCSSIILTMMEDHSPSILFGRIWPIRSEEKRFPGVYIRYHCQERIHFSRPITFLTYYIINIVFVKVLRASIKIDKNRFRRSLSLCSCIGRTIRTPSRVGVALRNNIMLVYYNIILFTLYGDDKT